MLKRLMGGIVSCIAFFLAVTHPAFAQDLSGSIVSGNFETLKTALEEPNRDTTVVVPGGEYVVTSPITISKDLTLKNKAGEQVILKLGFFNNNSDSEGESMFTVASGTTTLDADTNGNLVFDGGAKITFDHREDFESNQGKSITSICGRGVLFTLNNDTQGVINHATFTNVAYAGATAGALMVKSGSTLTMQDGAITHNYALQSQYTESMKYINDSNAIGAQAAGMSVYGGTFIMNGGSITDNYNHFGTGGAIGVSYPRSGGPKPKIEIHGGVISNNSSHSWSDKAQGAGGGIFLGVSSSLLIDRGTFEQNYANGAGGFVYADWGTNITINGGTFNNNSAQRAGGVVSAVDKFMSYNPSTHDNEVVSGDLNPYGITDISNWYDMNLGVKLVVNGGTFTQNKSYMGGALYIACDNAEVNGGVFNSNEANRFGGAIYLSTAPYRLKIKNAYFEKNIATSDSTTIGGNFYPDLDPDYFHTGSGGAVWYCPSGTGDINVSNGAAIVDNTAESEGADFTSMEKESGKGYSVSVANRMLGGGYVAWLSDTIDSRANDETQELDPIVNSDQNINLKARVSDRAKATARSLAKTVFVNNKAKRGGAVATNGHVDFGDADLAFNLVVKTEWDSEITQPHDMTAELYIVTTNDSGEETEHFVQTIDLKADADHPENSYRAELTNLPLENYGRTTYRVKVVGDEYQTSYTKARNEEAPEAGNTFSTADLQNSDTETIVVNNKPYRSANFTFRSTTAGKELPSEVMNLLPQPLTKLSVNDTVTAPEISPKAIHVADGTWTFEGWDNESQTVDNTDLTFVGSWSFAAKTLPPHEDPVVKEYTAHFSFASANDDVALPDSVLRLLPEEISHLHAGDLVTAPSITSVTVVVDNGTWTFVGWDYEVQTVENEDLTFVGSWLFTPNEEPQPILDPFGEDDNSNSSHNEDSGDTNAKTSRDASSQVLAHTADPLAAAGALPWAVTVGAALVALVAKRKR